MIVVKDVPRGGVVSIYTWTDVGRIPPELRLTQRLKRDQVGNVTTGSAFLDYVTVLDQKWDLIDMGNTFLIRIIKESEIFWVSIIDSDEAEVHYEV